MEQQLVVGRIHLDFSVAYLRERSKIISTKEDTSSVQVFKKEIEIDRAGVRQLKNNRGNKVNIDKKREARFFAKGVFSISCFKARFKKISYGYRFEKIRPSAVKEDLLVQRFRRIIKNN
ncbi:12839_t:CDS:2 [Cetraspora pellucida]|uniref:12839_t:CDS:1 n=1 Tax=Cetraspora pellucida TaxID=1433469 RepID=A0A9N8Z1Y9_9GLOM|nr:12839_t:CDS:2 [Cetraspora pellucida]